MYLFSKIGPSELTVVLVVLFVVVVPVAAIAFSRSGRGLSELGKGTFAIDKEEPEPTRGAPPPPDPAVHEMEVRQMVEAAAFRRRRRGERELDSDAEIQRLLSGSEPGESGEPSGEVEPGRASEDPEMAQIRREIRELVVANNERRKRRGEAPLDIESEVGQRLREWT